MPTPQARLLYGGGGEIHFTAATDLLAGEVLPAATIGGALPGVVASAGPVKAGDRCTAYTKGVFAFQKASATTFSKAARVDWNDGTNLAVAPTGTFGLGGAVNAGLNGQTEVVVSLNEFGDETGGL